MIIRSEKKKNYTILPNELLLDENISDKARGLLVRLLSRPDSWNVNVEHLVATGKSGHTSVRSSLKELEVAGYIQKTLVRERNGKITRLEYSIYDSLGENTDDDDHIRDARKKVEHQSDHFVDDNEMVDDMDDLITETDDIDETQVEETCNMETATVINTVIKQILKETTTTPEQEPKHDPVICAQAVPSSSCSIGILNLIPEKHKSPMVISLVNKAIIDYPAKEVSQAIAYSASNVRGGTLQFRAYLDKTLKNKWADGWAPAPEKLAVRQAASDQFRHLPTASLKMLAEVGNLVAIEALQLRENPSDMQYARC